MLPQGPAKDDEAVSVAAAAAQVEIAQARPRRISWGRLPRRVFDIDMQHCPNCGAGAMKIIAALLEQPVIQKILNHLGLEPQPPSQGRAREPGRHFAT
ncbi:MAG: hypothetical protein ABIX12_02280 [Rubrivivax sp.]